MLMSALRAIAGGGYSSVHELFIKELYTRTAAAEKARKETP